MYNNISCTVLRLVNASERTEACQHARTWTEDPRKNDHISFNVLINMQHSRNDIQSYCAIREEDIRLCKRRVGWPHEGCH
jgi:hypothetical protein